MKDSLRFIPIDHASATAMVIEHHYMHRKCPISWCWGIRDESTGELVGVLTIGKLQSYSTRSGLVGEGKDEEKFNPAARANDVYELNRLWVSDKCPRNTESRFIGWCLRELRKEYPKAILVSLADGGFNHVGYVYQATNWLYTGCSTPFNDINVEGYNDCRSVPMELRGGFIYKCPDHGRFPTPYVDLPQPQYRPCPDCGKDAKRMNARNWAMLDEVIDAKGVRHKIYRKQRTIKHRYVWFANSKDRALLKWEVLPYPKEAAKQINANSDSQSASTGS